MCVRQEQMQQESNALRAKLREAEERYHGMEAELRRLQRAAASPAPGTDMGCVVLAFIVCPTSSLRL